MRFNQLSENTKIKKKDLANWNHMYGADAIEYGTEIINLYNIHDSSEQQFIIEIIDSYTDEFDIRDPADRKKLSSKMKKWWRNMTGKSIKHGSQFDESGKNSTLPLSQEVSNLLGRGDTVYIEIDDTNVAEIVGVNLDKDKRTVIVGFGKSRKSIPVHNDTYRIDDSQGYNVIRKIEESTKQEIPMTNKKINEGVLSEEEDTGVMAKYTLYMLAKSATRLHKMVQDEEEVSQEVLDKLRAAYDIITEIKTGYDAVKSLENLPLAPTVGVTEEEALRPYKVLHVKKQPIEVKASTSYEAATKAAAIWKLKSTAGVSAYLLDTVHVAEQASSMFESARKKAKLNAKK